MSRFGVLEETQLANVADDAAGRTKRCRGKCGKVLPRSAFYLDHSRGRQYRKSVCIDCYREMVTDCRNAMRVCEPVRPAAGMCDECYNLAHRVQGDVCKCGLRWKAETVPRPELWGSSALSEAT